MRRSFAVVVAGVVLVLGVQKSLAEPRTELAILPIVVHTLEHKEYLEAGLADMLASRMGRVPGLAVIRVQSEDRGTTDLEAAKALGREAGAQYVLFGSFTQFGEGASLDLQCAAVSEEAEGPSRSMFIQSGSLGDIIPHLDQVAEKVARHLLVDDPATGGAPEGLPSVSAAAPGGGGAISDQALQDAISELEALRGRVDALEQRVFAPSVESFPEEDLRSGREVLERDPETHSDLR
jgi:TolB-like protein